MLWSAFMHAKDVHIRPAQRNVGPLDIEAAARELLQMAQLICGTCAVRKGGSKYEKAENLGQTEQLVAVAEEEIRRRRFRSRYLPADLFGEAAWSILLDLYISE